MINLLVFTTTRQSEFINHHVNQVLNSKDILLKKYNSKFLYFLWPPNNESEKEIYNNLLNSLINNKINVFEVKKMIKNMPTNKIYIEKDGHPSFYGNNIISDYIIEKMI